MQSCDVSTASTYGLLGVSQRLGACLDLRCTERCLVAGETFLHKGVDVDTEVSPSVPYEHAVRDSSVRLSDSNTL